MLTDLTEEQKKTISDIKKEFISPLDRKINEEYARESIETIFRLCEFPEPKIYIADSPMAGVKKAGGLSKANIYVHHEYNTKFVYNKQLVEELVTKQELIVRRQMSNLADKKIIELFRDSAGQCIQRISLAFLGHIHDRVHAQSFSGTMITGLDFYMDCEAIKYIPWTSFYLHFKKLGILENELFDAYWKYIQSGIFTNMYFRNANIVILIKNPLYAIGDNRGRLSNKDGYAIEWSDGYGIHYVNGVHFGKELYDSIFINKTIKGRDILLLKNAEQKAIAIQQYGYYDMIDDIGAKKIDEMEIMTQVGKAVNELYDFEIKTDVSWRVLRGRFVKVVDHSTGKVTCLGVPIEKSTETIRGAIAWTFGLNETEYKPVIET